MCSPASAEVIREVVNDFTSAGTMFTAFEVSLEVQRRQQDQGKPVERHRDMRHRIHTELEGHVLSGQYARDLRDVGADIPANVYYRVGTDPTQYVPLNRGHGVRSQQTPPPGPPKAAPVTPGDKPVTTDQPGTPSITTPDPQPAHSGGRYNQGQAGIATPTSPHDPKPADHGNPTDGGRKPDARGTVTVPSGLMRNLGFNFNDTAYVYGRTAVRNGMPALVVAKTVPAGVQPITSYTVDENRNVRVTAGTQAIARLQTGPDASFRFDQDGSEIVITNA